MENLSDESSSFASCMTHWSPIPGSKDLLPRVTSIGTLPREILQYIFLQYASIEPCGPEISTHKIRVIQLAHVSTYWRHIAIGFPTLWSHVDISLRPKQATHLTITAARAFAIRAGQLNLDVHLVVRSLLSAHEFGAIEPMLQFLESISHRIQYLDIWAGTSLDNRPDIYLGGKSHAWNITDLILDTCLASAVPGIFKMLRVANPGPSPTTRAIGDGRMLATRTNFESVSRHITIANLCDVFFPWSSPLYSGLIELRLTHHGNVEIDEVQLTTLLASSPYLRYLQFGLEVTEATGPFAPVPLEHLEVLILERDAGRMLRLISFGIKFRYLSIEYIYDDWGRPVGFLPPSSTSNHTTNGPQDFSSLFDLLHLTPSINQLTLKSLPRFMEGSTVEPQLTTPIHLDSLYLGNCQLVFYDLVQLITQLHVQKLVMWGNSNIHDSNMSLPSKHTPCPSTNAVPVSETLTHTTGPPHLSIKQLAISTKDTVSVYLTKDELTSKLSKYVRILEVLDKEPRIFD